jgi:hypothetical protein
MTKGMCTIARHMKISRSKASYEVRHERVCFYGGLLCSGILFTRGGGITGGCFLVSVVTESSGTCILAASLYRSSSVEDGVDMVDVGESHGFLWALPAG